MKKVQGSYRVYKVRLTDPDGVVLDSENVYVFDHDTDELEAYAAFPGDTLLCLEDVMRNLPILGVDMLTRFARQISHQPLTKFKVSLTNQEDELLEEQHYIILEDGDEGYSFVDDRIDISVSWIERYKLIPSSDPNLVRQIERDIQRDDAKWIPMPQDVLVTRGDYGPDEIGLRAPTDGEL